VSYDIDDINGLPAKERTFRIEIFTDPESDYKIIAHRERVNLTPTGVAAQRLFSHPTERLISQIIGETYTFNGKTLTGAELLGLISLMADTWKTEDEISIQPQQIRQKRGVSRVKPKTIKEIKDKHSKPHVRAPKVDMRPLTQQIGRIPRR
jgi:hypothetical protein